MLASLVTGLALGGLYAMTAIIYNVMYSSSKVLSLTTGHLLMVGGVAGAWMISVVGLNLLLGIAIVLCIGAAFGGLTEVVAVRRTLAKPEDHLWLLSTLALATIVQQCVALWWGTEPRPFPQLLPIDSIGYMHQKYWLPVIVSALMAIAIELFSRRTILGKSLRALAEDELAARARGMDTGRLRLFSYVLAGVLGAIAGLAAGQITFAYYALGLSLTLNGFVALALGGIGSNLGALIGGLILGLITAFGTHFFGGEFQNTISIGLLILFLIIRPQGLFGSRKLRQV
jgi:branched-chain amino acid transport system permease protein